MRNNFEDRDVQESQVSILWNQELWAHRESGVSIGTQPEEEGIQRQQMIEASE